MLLEPSLTCPQTRQSARFVELFRSSRPASFALPSLRRRCVNRVARPSFRMDPSRESQKDFAIHSAKLATAVRHMSAVSDSVDANDAINRQLPSRCSKNHSPRSCSDVSKLSSSSSTFGRTASIRSAARESRLRRSECRTPGSRPSAASANRDSDSSTAYR